MSTDLTLEFHRNDICILVDTAAKSEGKTCRETLLKEAVNGVQEPLRPWLKTYQRKEGKEEENLHYDGEHHGAGGRVDL